jgi:hypothetical protein
MLNSFSTLLKLVVTTVSLVDGSLKSLLSSASALIYALSGLFRLVLRVVIIVLIVGGSFRGLFSILYYSLVSGYTMSHSPYKST